MTFVETKSTVTLLLGSIILFQRRSNMEDTELSSHFEFGSNWQKLVPHLDEARLSDSVSDIQKFLGVSQLNGLSFLDVGCGSGLSSLAAFRLGASPILSVDIDPKNLQNAMSLRKKFGADQVESWQIKPASIVNQNDVLTLPPADVVYSWGVLHHTGSMWQGIENCANLVRPSGYLYLMLYTDAVLAPLWKKIKRLYTRSGPIVQSALRGAFATMLVSGMILKAKNPFRVIKDYSKKNRGMSWYIDVTDWIGGYPFEYASPDQVISFLNARGFELVNIYPKISKKSLGLKGTGSYQYLFKSTKPKTTAQ